MGNSLECIGIGECFHLISILLPLIELIFQYELTVIDITIQIIEKKISVH